MGNTRLKWRLLQGARTLDRGAFGWAVEGKRATPWSELAPEVAQLDRIRVASVAGKDRNRELVARVSERWGLNPDFAATTAAAAGVVNSYDDPSGMGVDRWLALVAAYHRTRGACLVVDCGSAVTVELLDNQGCHQGGYIVPGLRLMRRALFSDTEAVKVPRQVLPPSLEPGNSTESAVNNGLPLMVVGLVDQALQQLRAKVAETSRHERMPPLIVTGGDGEALLPHLAARLKVEPQSVPDLVLEGLALVLP